MRLVRRTLPLGCFLLVASSLFAQQTAVQHSAITPTPRSGPWMKMHEKLNERAKAGPVDLIFLGDSITQMWHPKVWEKFYSQRHALNLGISGDRTQEVLWRLDHGNIEGLHPKLVIVMIGTNNSNNQDNTAAEIADGIKAIVAKLRERLPETKLLLLAIFPRSQTPNAQREKVAEASRLASEVADNKMVYFLDIGPKFLSADQSISKEIMPDYLHLSQQGYEIWAQAIDAKVAELMGEKGN